MLTEPQSTFLNPFLNGEKRNLNESMFHSKQQYQMITENISKNIRPKAEAKMSRPLRIVKETKGGLIVSNGNNQMIFKRFAMDDESMAKHLQKRYLLRHESLIKIHNIEYDKVKKQEGDNNGQLYCGILFEKYIKTMEQSIKEMLHFTHEEVIQTFTPIKEVIDYMVYQDYDPGQLSFASVVCNQNYQIKFIDSFFMGQGFRLKEREVKIYEELAQMIFSLLFPDVKKAKPWKYKYQIAERQLNAQGFHFFQDIYKKFATITTKSIKSKPIKKEIKTKAKNKSSEFVHKNDSSSPQKKNLHQTLINCQAGKQNQIIQ